MDDDGQQLWKMGIKLTFPSTRLLTYAVLTKPMEIDAHQSEYVGREVSLIRARCSMAMWDWLGN